MSDKKGRSLSGMLSKIKEKANPSAMLTSMLSEMLPGALSKFVTNIEEMEQPEDQGGKLPAGWDKICYCIVSIEQQLTVSIHALKMNENGSMEMGPVINSFPLAELLKSNKFKL